MRGNAHAAQAWGGGCEMNRKKQVVEVGRLPVLDYNRRDLLACTESGTPPCLGVGTFVLFFVPMILLVTQ